MSDATRQLRKRWTAAVTGFAAPVLSWLAALLLRGLGATWRIDVEGDNPLEPPGAIVVAALWHRDVLVTAYQFRDQGYSVPVSRSRDGDLITGLLLALGYAPPPRGSSSRGGAVALRGLVRLVEAGTTVSLPVDGPRGPARKSKIGVVSLARLTGVPITPLAFSARPCFRFGSWDGTLLPAPFARVVLRFGEPIAVGRDASPEEEAAVVSELDRTLGALTDGLDERMGLAKPAGARADGPPA